jgi:regulator of sirC expression with transglutaminase-like and TPR domain
VHYRVGLVQLQLGKRDEARQALETFLALAPSRYANPIADARQRLAQLR